MKLKKNMCVWYPCERTDLGGTATGVVSSCRRRQKKSKIYDLTIQVSYSGETETVAVMDGDVTTWDDRPVTLADV